MRLIPTVVFAFSCATFVLPAAPLAAQQTRQLTADDYARAESFLGASTGSLVSGLPGQPTWLEDGRFWYRTTTAAGAAFITVDPARGTRSAAFDNTRLASALAAATGGQVRADQLPLQGLQFSTDASSITLTAANRRWTCSLQDYTCSPADTARAGAALNAPRASVTSPDGRHAAFIRDHNLWVKDLTTNEDRQLTTDGIEDFGYATNNAGWTRSDVPVLLWSPDSRRIATFQHDSRGVSEMHLVSTVAGPPVLESWRYPLPQDSAIFRIHRVIVDVENARTVRLDMAPDQHRSTISDHIADGSTFLDVEWYPDASHVAFVSSSRDHKHAVFRVANAETGAVRTVFEERSPTQFQSAFAAVGTANWRVLPATNEVLWWSQRDDWGHLYLYDLGTGALKRQITSGSWNVGELVRVDASARMLYFTGVGREQGRDPYFQHFYRIGMDGSGLRLLTAENANHAIRLSPDGAYFVDTYSTPTEPPVSVLRRTNDGAVVVELERADISRLVATGWKPPEPFVVKARDGQTDLYGLMFTPTRLDSTASYPIVNYIYPGPWGSSVGSRNFSPARSDHQALAELGFVVVVIDGMGTEWRSKSFGDFYYGDMGDNTLPDQIAGMRQLAERHRFIDIDRAGMWGHSGGGFATAAAMFRHPDFFKVGVSQAGNHDNRLYEDDWGERFMPLMQSENGAAVWESQANQLVAANLQGRLLLAHGVMDSNVPPYNTYLVVDALIKANKDFDLIIFPHQRHGFGVDNNYMMRRRWDYFVKHLMGAEPPTEYQIGRPRT
ncbi:MAG: DPP IV N-terminal domain-containing protein [Gemmatimonadetes bacterium]|nr:DPP IV N-terminal domain-containing protein [Gemmatimonadota bacterium]